MHINLESIDKYSVQAYSDTEIEINSTVYYHNVIVSREEIINEWPLSAISALDEQTLAPLLLHKPEIILIGHQQTGRFAPAVIRQQLMQQRIALESMSIGAACRTFNVLLSEGRAVVLGIIF